ncbi:unnamed protein product [Diplocarpon coronariae]
MAGNGSSARQDGVNEQTSLLSALEGLDGHLGADTFDNFVSRSLSITRGLGIELESQETALLRGPRRDGSVRKAPRASSRPSTLRRKKPHASSFSGQEDIDEEGGSEVDEPTSPCVADVSVSTFRLIFGGVLTAQFVADFDGTILGSSPPVVTSYFHSSNSASRPSTAFLLTSSSFQPLFGRLSDTIERKPPYMRSMTLLLLATVWCALA